jgi:hypothetical protein
MPSSISLADAPPPPPPAKAAPWRPVPASQRFTVLPGFGLSLGFTIFYLTLIVLIPLSATFLKTFTMTWDAFWTTVTNPSWPGCWCAIASLASGLSMHWWTCRSRCQPPWRVSR